MSHSLVSFDFQQLQSKWSALWLQKNLYAVPSSSEKPKKYVLVEFPYPSAAGLHMGHCRNYSMMDVYSRYFRMKGFNVLYPMGWDAFGLPTYNYAMKVKRDPHEVSAENVLVFKRQLQELGLSFDWDREIDTTDPQYYKWTQWIFVQLFNHYYNAEYTREDGGKGMARPMEELQIPPEVSDEGENAVREYQDLYRLAYKAKMPVYWCPFCKSGVANEEVTAEGTHERCDTPVEKRELEQWMLRITAYADRLIDDLTMVDYPLSVKSAQSNWIGRSEGITITYPVKGTDHSVTVFTTKPETNFGATFIVAAPDSNFIKTHSDLFPNKEAVDKYVSESLRKSDIQRLAEGKTKTGVFTGMYAVNHFTGKDMPIYVSDFVLGSVGTGIVVGVPGHDLRDFDFATTMGLEVVRVIVGEDKDESFIKEKAQIIQEGTVVNSDFLNGMNADDAREKIMSVIEEKGYGKRQKNYKLRDWVFSRQHYWGEPTPMVYCEHCGWQAVSFNELPVELPRLDDYAMGEDGSSPLEKAEEWKKTTCPSCGGAATRETDVMPNWAGSNWYYVRYLDPKNDNELVDKKVVKDWMPVDIYDGGSEHVTLHLLYSRFIYKFLYDLGTVPTQEPYKVRRIHGVVLGPDGKRMSKSKGNVINPDEIVAKYGADIVRMYVMFMGPYEGNLAWSDETLNGVRRFLNRVSDRIVEKIASPAVSEDTKITIQLEVLAHRIGSDITALKFNTSIAALMEFLNAHESVSWTNKQIATFLTILAPFAPFLAEELWSQLGNSESIHLEQWPKTRENDDSGTIEIPVQINGKIKARIHVEKNMSQENVIALFIKENAQFADAVAGGKVVYVPGKILSITAQG
ncbi:MAG: leucine--tRNA ligase [Candidatus Dojkabacteria bacterium]|nr:MAG: leucine--tRNA ligase [Candidatus Dojkabacteria bacterium]